MVSHAHSRRFVVIMTGSLQSCHFQLVIPSPKCFSAGVLVRAVERTVIALHRCLNQSILCQACPLIFSKGRAARAGLHPQAKLRHRRCGERCQRAMPSSWLCCLLILCLVGCAGAAHALPEELQLVLPPGNAVEVLGLPLRLMTSPRHSCCTPAPLTVVPSGPVLLLS